jgi:16S rRNA (guanine527-N7)-methyltransferase
MTAGSRRIDDDEIVSNLSPYGCAPSAAQCATIRSYIELLLRWNQRISLTTVTDPLEVLKFHIGESVEAIRAAGIANGRLADIGSGAGLPGIPLALFAPKLHVTLVESNVKKAAFLSEIQRSLSPTNVSVVRGRFAELEASSGSVDFITARALGNYDDLLAWAMEALDSSGRIILWLGVDDASKISLARGWEWQPPHKIPGTKNRVLIMGRVLAE